MSVGELGAAELRAALHQVADLVADYLEQVGDYPVLPATEPGDVLRQLPERAPAEPEALEQILADYKGLIEPNLTHWNHPGFMAYFGITGSGPGVMAEMLAAATNVNAMLWRTSPAATELEERVCDWLREMVGLPEGFHGHINDTASIGTFLMLGVAREGTGLDIRNGGLAGRPEVAPMTVYTSEQAHSSIDKAAIALGLGLNNVRRIPTDEAFAMSMPALEAAIESDRRAGRVPIAVVATAGTTVTTSVDPIAEIAVLCKREQLWFHVDAAYAGNAAICPEMRAPFAGWEAADSIVINPHKWLFTPFDCSVLLVRRPELLREAFSVVPEYLRSDVQGVTNLMDLGIQLGRRFRSLKLWMVIRAYGVEGLRERIRRHCELARELAGWVEADDRFELLLQPGFSTICLRLRLGGDASQDALNERLLNAVNASGRIFISHAVLGGRYALRVALGNIRTDRREIETVWRLLRESAETLLAR
jgi:aromatic-L-amino-acid decarboxylase